MMSGAAVLLALILILVVLGLYWRQLSHDERRVVWSAIRTHLGQLFRLSLVFALPAALLLPWPGGIPRWPFVAASLLVWGVYVIAYWDRRALPVGAALPGQSGRFLPGVPPAAPPLLPPLPDGDVPKHYRWRFDAGDDASTEQSVDLTLNAERYETARAEERAPVGEWAQYAAASMPEVETLAANFYRLHHGRGWSTLQQASNVLCFTQQCIVYSYDEDTAPLPEWPRYPIETLMDETGDCEDDVILAAAVLKRLGFDVALLYYPGHCALGVAGADHLPGEFAINSQTGLKYFYGETTDSGWHLGEVPRAFRGSSPESIEIVHRPVEE